MSISVSRLLLDQKRLCHPAKRQPGDGFDGLPTYEPFDRVIITAGAPSIPETLVNQMKPGGIMIIPMDNAEGDGQTMLKITKMEDGTLKQESFGDFKFVPMLKEIGND